MWHLTKLALRSRVITIFLALVVAGVSVWAFLGLKTELIPDISFPYTTVVAVYPQATPDTVVNEVTAPIEKVVWDEWSGKGLKHVTSTSSAGISLVMAEFEYGTDMAAVNNSLNAGIRKLSLPQAVLDFPKLTGSNAKNPQIIPINMNILPLMKLSLSADLPPEQLKQIADAKIIPELTKVGGVLRVDTEGGDKDQVVIAPDPVKMNRYSISMAHIAGLLGTSFSSLNEVENTSLGTGNVKLSDIATVGKGPPPLSAITRTNGRPSVGISVVKTESANTVETANAINARIAELKGKLGDGVIISTIFDQSDFIKSSVSELWEKAAVGGVLAILVVFLFLLAVRASLITAISIPLSLFIGFLCMRLTGITINILTLMAMALAVGRLIDDSIVMVEVIYRRRRLGENFKEAAIGGAKEIATPITTATLATVAIFLPLMFVGGIVGEIFIPFALTVTFAMLASLLVALALIPVLSKWLVSSKPKAINVRDNWYQKTYVSMLKWTLGHRVTVVVIAVVLLIGSMGLLSVTGTSFMSGSMSEATISINITLPANTEINNTSAVAAKVETLLSRDTAVRSFNSTVGTASTSMAGIMSASQGGGGSNTATITVYLKPGADLQQKVSALDKACKGIVENGTITVGSDSRGGMGAGLSTSNVNLSIQGQNQEDIAKVTAQLIGKLQGVNGIADLKSDLTTVVPKVNITLNSAKVATSGLPAAQMGQLPQEFMLLMIGGTLPGKTVTIDNENYPINIKGIAQNLSDEEQAKNLKIGFPQSVTLNAIANVSVQELPSHISHTDTVLSATITGTITDKNVGAVNKAVQQQVDALPAHPGVDIVTAGIAQEMGNTFSRMFIAIIIAIVIVFLIVIFMMRSIINPLIIMVSLPLAFIGSIPALLISGHTLGISAMMGLLMLIGIVLTNAIVLISMVEQQRKNGLNTHNALLEGGKVRLRPILMTALTTIFAMVPIAVSASSGTMLGAELAIVVIGGMISSTFLTLFVIPAIYSLARRHQKQPAVS
jgi:hydrophobic/amphiphilic exporter-1 (mainly G- bacteria), HAE1 family